ncbi:MAG: Cna B-type domain-containing protein, partial [Anaerovoracaceae bacterium]
LPKGTIQIAKVVNGTTDPIEGVTFRVYKVNSSTDHTRVSGWYDGADYAEVVTDEDGIAAISDLEDGVYEIEEVTTNLPNWIAVPDTTSTYATISGTAGTAVTIENSVKTTDVTATKKWVGSDGTTADTGSHPTVYFKLYRSVSGGDVEAVSGAAIKKVKTAAGKSRTSVTWTDLPEYDNTGKKYTYSVREVDADGNDYTPAGYTKTEEDLTVINTLKKSSTSTSETDSESKTNDSDQADSGKTDNDTVQTGDTSGLGLWVTLLVVSAAVLAVIGYRKRRNNDH